jgi:hypothetical protein
MACIRGSRPINLTRIELDALIRALQFEADAMTAEPERLSEYQVYVAEHYASIDFLLDLKREITEFDFATLVDALIMFHPERD